MTTERDMPTDVEAGSANHPGAEGELRRAYAVTLEYDVTYCAVVAVEAPDVKGAIAAALQYDGDGWDSYDHTGDTYVGHVAEWPDLEAAERVSCRHGEGLPVPLDMQSDGERLAVVTAQRDVLLATLKRLVWMTRDGPVLERDACIGEARDAIAQVEGEAPVDSPAVAAGRELLAVLIALDERGHTQATWSLAKRAIAQAKAAGLGGE